MQIKSGPRSKNAELPAQGNEITMSIPKNCLIRLQPQKNLPLPAGLPRIHHYKVFSLKAQARHSDAAVRQLPLPHPTAEQAALKTHCVCARACRSGDCLFSYIAEFILFFQIRFPSCTGTNGEERDMYQIFHAAFPAHKKKACEPASPKRQLKP
jgi:hypothetical protein